MYLLVSTKIAALRKCPLTFLALIRFFSSVPPHMDFKGARTHEFVIANFTCKWSFSRMSSLVVSQMPLCCETHFAICEITPKGLLPVMDPHMSE
jgi:hypothetical protein